MFELRSNETLIKEDRVMVVHSALSAVMGTLYLTNQRIVVVENRWAMMFGLIGLLFAKLFPGKVTTHERAELVSYERGQHGINKKVLLLKFAGGEECKLILNVSYEEWEQALKTAN